MTKAQLIAAILDASKIHHNISTLGMKLPDAPELEYQYKEWQKRNKEAKRREALGYNQTLGSLLDSENPKVVRLAKGIKKEINK